MLLLFCFGLVYAINAGNDVINDISIKIDCQKTFDTNFAIFLCSCHYLTYLQTAMPIRMDLEMVSNNFQHFLGKYLPYRSSANIF